MSASFFVKMFEFFNTENVKVLIVELIKICKKVLDKKKLVHF